MCAWLKTAHRTLILSFIVSRLIFISLNHEFIKVDQLVNPVWKQNMSFFMHDMFNIVN